MKRAGTFTTGLKLSKVKLVEDERQIFYKVEVLVSSVVFKMMTFCQLAFQNFHYPLTVINELRIKKQQTFSWYFIQNHAKDNSSSPSFFYF